MRSVSAREKPRYTLSLVLLVVIAACLTILSMFLFGTAASLASLSHAAAINVPFESQTAIKDEVDEDGHPYYLGDSTTSQLWRYGCGVASLAMVYEFYGYDTSLINLNTGIRDAGGFSGPLLNWSDPEAIAEAGGSAISGIERINTSNPTRYQDRVDGELEDGHPVIAYLGGQHYVVLTGFNEERDYLVNDPWKETSDLGQGVAITNTTGSWDFDDITQIVFVYPGESAPTNGIPVEGTIGKEYYVWGGSKGSLGNPLARSVALTETQILWQRFENGAIIDLPDRPAVLHGSVAQRWLQTDSIMELGLPLDDIYSYSFGESTVWQADFERGSIRVFETEPPTSAVLLKPESSFRAEFYSNPDLSGTPDHVRLDSDLIFDWGIGAPGPDVSPEAFSARWTGDFTINSPIRWRYNFKIDTDGAVRVEVDGEEVFNTLSERGGGEFSMILGKGTHQLTVTYQHQLGPNMMPARLLFARSAWPATPVFAAERTVGPTDSLPAPAGSDTVRGLSALTAAPLFFDVVLPGERALLNIEVHNNGTVAWEPGDNIQLRQTLGPQNLVGIASWSTPNSVVPGESITWPVQFEADTPGVATVQFQMHRGDFPFGSKIDAMVITLPEQLRGLEDRIRQLVEEQVNQWQVEVERNLQDLRDTLLDTIQHELKEMADSLLDQILVQCNSVFAIVGLTLLVIIRAGRRWS